MSWQNIKSNIKNFSLASFGDKIDAETKMIVTSNTSWSNVNLGLAVKEEGHADLNTTDHLPGRKTDKMAVSGIILHLATRLLMMLASLF